MKRLRYAISPRSQIIYIHGREPQFEYVEYEAGYPYIWLTCDVDSHHYPRAFEVHDWTRNQPYEGLGTLIPRNNYGTWDIYDCGPGNTEEFNRVRWPNKAPMPLNKDYQGDRQ